jgi:hypothetical protein
MVAAVGRELPYWRIMEMEVGIRMGTARWLDSNCGFLFPWRQIQAFGPAARFSADVTALYSVQGRGCCVLISEEAYRSLGCSVVKEINPGEGEE